MLTFSADLQTRGVTWSKTEETADLLCYYLPMGVSYASVMDLIVVLLHTRVSVVVDDSVSITIN